MTNRKEKNSTPDGKTKAGLSTSGIVADQILDITADVCPMTFVRTRLALDRLPPGGLLRTRLRGDEPRRSVPANAVSLGHEVVSIEEFPDGTAEIVLRVGPGIQHA